MKGEVHPFILVIVGFIIFIIMFVVTGVVVTQDESINPRQISKNITDLTCDELFAKIDKGWADWTRNYILLADAKGCFE